MVIAFWLAALALLPLQIAQEEAIKTRIVSHPEAPAILVGQPCTTGPNSQILPSRKAPPDVDQELFGPIKSRQFVCSLKCELGIKATGARQIVAIRLGRIRLQANGVSAGFVSPLTPIASGNACNGLPLVVDVHHPESSDVHGFLVYIAEVVYSDGTSWHVPDNEHFHHQVTDVWSRSSR